MLHTAEIVSVGEGDFTMSTSTKVRASWAVRNRAGQVVVIFDGTQARVAAEEWASARGYRVESVVFD